MSGPGSGWRRIDPRSIVVESVPRVALTFVGALLLSTSVPFDEVFIRDYIYRGAAVIAVAGVVQQVVRWATTFYTVDGRTLRLRSGWLLRRRTAVDRQKVRSIVLRSGPLARPLGLTRVSLGTGETQRDASMVLAWVPTVEAHRLRETLLGHSRPVMEGTGELARGRARWALWAPFTALSVSIWAGTYILAYQLFFAWLGWIRTLRWVLTEQVDVLAALRVLVLAPVAVAIVGAVVVYLECWWGFRADRAARGTLEIRHGLIVHRSVSLQESRVRGVEFVQPLLPRLMNRARVLAVSTGIGAQTTLARQLPAARHRTLLPLGPAEDAARTASAVLGHEVDLRDLVGHPVQARYKRYRWAIFYTGAVLLGLWVLLREPLLARPVVFVVVGLLVLAVALLLANDSYRSLGHRLEPDLLLLRNGTLRRSTSVIQRRTVLGWVFRQSWFQYRLGLVTVAASTAAGKGSYWLHDVGCAEAVSLARTITPEMIDPHLAAQQPPERAVGSAVSRAAQETSNGPVTSS